MRDLHEHIQSTLDLVRKHQDVLASAETRLPSVGLPTASTAPGAAAQAPAPPLAAAAERDRQIIQELMRLQRTLSRQSFRGAESARRLVRRLVRRAQQNVDALEQWQAGKAVQTASTVVDDGQLGSLLADIANSLIQLQHAGRAFYDVARRPDSEADERPLTP